MARIVTTIDVSGPFFTKDIRKTFRQNIHSMLEAMAEEGTTDVVAQLESGASGRALIAELGDRVSDHVIGRVHAMSGKNWVLNAVVSVSNRLFTGRQGVSLMAAAASVESRVHAFRRTTGRLQRSRAVNVAELTKGLN